MRVPLDERSYRDEDLILYYYGEDRRRSEEVRRLLEQSPEARRRYEELCGVLAAVESAPVPEPDAAYGQRVWNRLRAEIKEDRPRGLWKSLFRPCAPPRLAVAGAFVGLLALAFVAGRFWQKTALELNEPVATALLSEAGRERIVMGAVADHLDRSQQLLLELANAPSGAGLDVRLEREGAEDLLGDNRLYRRTTENRGQADLAAVLEELEMLLLELAHGPEEIASQDLEDFRLEIDDVLFKVQVLGWRLRQQQEDPQQQDPQQQDNNALALPPLDPPRGTLSAEPSSALDEV